MDDSLNICEQCGSEEGVWGDNPYLSELFGEESECCLCEHCYTEALRDI